MTVTSVLVVGVLVMVICFAVAFLVFGPAGAVCLTGVVGACFGGPAGGGVGLVVGLILIPVVGLFLGGTDEPPRA